MTIVLFILLLYVAQANGLRVPQWIFLVAWIATVIRFMKWLETD